MLSLSEIKLLALDIENELYDFFKETGHKYKAKYRSLIFNIKDSRNKISQNQLSSLQQCADIFVQSCIVSKLKGPKIVVCLFALLRFTDSDYPFGIFWPLCCLSFDLQILITPLISSNSSSKDLSICVNRDNLV